MMLQVERLRFFRQTKLVVNVPALALAAGDMLGVLGPNGAGKSSFFKLMTGEWPGEGQVRFHDRAMRDWPRLELARHLGILPQGSQLDFPFTAMEVASLGLTPLKVARKDADALVLDKLRQTHTEHLREHIFSTLSGGEKQRVQLARVLVQISQAEQPPLLLLDEPTSAQDLGQQHHVLALARSLAKAQGFGVMAILHDLNQVLHYCDRVLVLHQGEAVLQGEPNRVLTADAIEQVWGYRPVVSSSPEGVRLF